MKKVKRNWMKEKWNELCRPRRIVYDVEIDGVIWHMTDAAKEKYKPVWDLLGIAKILPVDSQIAVTKYCSKYVVKGGQIDICGLKPL